MRATIVVPAVGVHYYPSNPRMSGKLPVLIIGGAVLLVFITGLAVVVAHFRRKARMERIERFHRRKDRERG